jgi:beta-lactam-binding protein with PASTA domain
MVTFCDHIVALSHVRAIQGLLPARACVTTLTLLPMDTTLSSLQAGQLLDGRYRVGSWIARGGMATVYMGTDTKLDRTVALKVAHPELAGDREFVRRFSDEARSVARLSSPNVVGVFDQGAHGDLLYLVMEYVPGRTLRDLLRERGRLSPREALDIISGVLSGLAAAHLAGIIHRDVKPENVLLGDGNTIKVADFGLARAASAIGHTRTGMIIGTAAYLAPEQVSRSTSDERTDVYAAGVMLYEMLTGSQPHTGDSPLAVAHKHVSDQVPAPSRTVLGLPPSLDALVAMSTSRDPDLRPANASQFLHAITDVRGGMPIGGRGAARAAGPGPSALMPAPLPPGTAAGPAQAPAPGGRHAQHAQHARGTSPGADTAGIAAGGPDDLSGDGGFPFFNEPGQAHGGPTGSQYSPMPGGYGPPEGQGGTNHTLIVPAGGHSYRDDVPYAGMPYRAGDGPPDHGRMERYRERAEPLLQRWLFSRRLVYVLLTVAVVAIVGVITWWVTDGQFVTVPQVRAEAASTAQAELQNLGFAVKVGPGQHNNQVAKGGVIRTDPAIGTSVKRGAEVTIIESTGPVMITVPQVTGLSQAAAVAQLKKQGLTVGAIATTASATIPAGEVISTTPVAGTAWPQPKPVKIAVSAGPPLPNFVGQQFGAAQGQAQQGGYQLNQANVSSTQPTGTIISQSPPAGSPISKGEVVNVQVSSGPPMVPIPNVQGLSVDAATAELQQAGFQVAVSTGPFQGKTVASFSPTGQAPKGSTITLTLNFSFP